MKVLVVHGAPLSGKSTYVNEHIKDNDIVFDYDKIMSALTNQPIHKHNDNLMDYILDIRSVIISKLKSETTIDTAYIVITKLDEQFKRSLTGLNAQYKEMKISSSQAKQRLYNNPGNRDVSEWEDAIDRYFATNKEYADFHNTVEWKRKRKVILKRDNYRCKECGRYGKVVEANTVHHILPIEERPDLRFNNNNLVSLCEEHHEKMHNKFNGTLSKLGDSWRDRTLRQHPNLRERAIKPSQ